MCLCKNLHFMVCNTKLLSTSLRVVAQWRCVTVRRRRAARDRHCKSRQGSKELAPYTFLKLKYPHYKMGCSKSRVTTVRQFTWNEIFSVVRPSFRFSCIPKINLLLLPVPLNTGDYVTPNHEFLCQQNQSILKIMLYDIAFFFSCFVNRSIKHTTIKHILIKCYMS